MDENKCQITVDYNFHSPADTNASTVGSHFWVYVLQLPRAGQATHTPAYFCWTRTLVIVGKHVLQLCTPRHSYIYQARGVLATGLLVAGPCREMLTVLGYLKPERNLNIRLRVSFDGNLTN